jgi:hypothetical protein
MESGMEIGTNREGRVEADTKGKQQQWRKKRVGQEDVCVCVHVQKESSETNTGVQQEMHDTNVGKERREREMDGWIGLDWIGLN